MGIFVLRAPQDVFSSLVMFFPFPPYWVGYENALRGSAGVSIERVAQRELLNLNRVEKLSLFPVLRGV
jgi:hypothetical protein